MFILTVALILLITSVSSQRRWAGTYPTELPGNDKQCNCDKPDIDESKQLNPENPVFVREDDEASAEESGKARWDPPEITDDKRDNERRNPVSRVDVDRRIEVTSGERGPVLTMIQKTPEVHRSNNRGDIGNIRRDSYPSADSRRRNNDSKGERGRGVGFSQVETVSSGRSGVIESHDLREDSFRKRGHEEPPKNVRDSTVIRETKYTTHRPIESNIRTYPEIKEPRLENERKDSFERSNDRSDHNPVIRTEEGRKEDSRSNPRNYRPSGGSNVNNRENIKPASTGRSYSGTQFQDNSRKEGRSTVELSHREEGGRYDTPCNFGTCKREEESKILKNQNPTLPPRIPARPYPITARVFTSTRFPEQVFSTAIPEIKIEDRKIITGDKGEARKIGGSPGVNYDTVVFPKDDDDSDGDDDGDRYRETRFGQSNRRNQQRGQTRNRRDVDIHEDVEILPGYDTSVRRIEVLKHYDEVDEAEVDIFSPVEIKRKKSR